MPTDPSVIDLGVIGLGRGRPDQLDGPDQLDRPDQLDPGARPAPIPGTGADAGPGGRPGPVGAPPPGRTTARLLRWWPLVALTVVLVGSTGAAAPVPHRLTLTFTVPTEQRTSVALTDQTLYVATGTPVSIQVEDPLWWLTAYRLSDGTPEWTVLHDVVGRPGTVEVTVLDGVPLVTGWRTYTAQMSWPSIDVDGQTTAYEPGTGQPLWTRRGFVTAYRDGQVILDLVEYAGSPLAPIGYTVTGVELATGQVLWTHQLAVGPGPDPAVAVADERLPSADVWSLSADGRYLATLSREGHLTVRDLTAGTESVHDLDQSWHEASLLAADGLVRVSMLKDRQRTLAVYDLHPLREQWTVTGLSSVTALSPCGPVLCLQTRQGLAALDPATGAQRWGVVQSWSLSAPLDPPWPEGYLQVGQTFEVAAATGVTDVTEVVLVDAATGQEELRLGGWRSHDAGRQHHPYPIVDLREPGVQRPGHPDYDPGRLWLGRVDPGLNRVDVLGSLDRVRSCEVGEHHVACVSTQQRVEVWRIG